MSWAMIRGLKLGKVLKPRDVALLLLRMMVQLRLPGVTAKQI